MSRIHALLRSQELQDAKTGMDELKSLPLEEAVQILEQLSTESEPKYRYRAVTGMSSISAERAEALALRLLDDDEARVRWSACDVLRMLGSKSAASRVAQLLATDPSPLVRDWAAFTLSVIGDESVLPVLLTAIETDKGTDWEGRPIRDTAAKSVREIRARIARR
jgi:HEAT repeat protein